MHIYVFNGSMLAGWVLLLVGGCIVNLGAGLAVGGLSLVALTVLASRLVGGIYVPEVKAAPVADGPTSQDVAPTPTGNVVKIASTDARGAA